MISRVFWFKFTPSVCVIHPCGAKTGECLKTVGLIIRHTPLAQKAAGRF